MNSDILLNLSQLIILAVSVLVVMLVAAFRREHGLVSGLTLAGLFLALFVFLIVPPIMPLEMTSLLIMDGYTLFFSSLIIFSAIIVCVLAYPYLQYHHRQNEEFYALLLLATFGAVVLASSTHFISFLLGMETLSISLYAMIAFTVHRRDAAAHPLEAAIKYLVLSASASAIMLFGIALLYAQTGTLSFMELPARIAESSDNFDPIVITGLMMLLAGIGFKLSQVPFHLWTADVYEGAPVPVTALIATVSKVAMLALVLRLLLSVEAYQSRELITGLAVLSAASMLIGNLLALRQDNIKRLLAYSSIAHLGYVLVILIAGASIEAPLVVEAIIFYIAAYTVTTLAGFAVISALSNASAETDQLGDYQGLFWQRPWLSTAMIIVMLSLAGIPLTMGFLAKFYAIKASIDGGLWVLLGLLIAGSGIGLYYYLRVIYLMLEPAVSGQASSRPRSAFGINLSLVGLCLLILVLGVYPGPLVDTAYHLASFFALP